VHDLGGRFEVISRHRPVALIAPTSPTSDIPAGGVAAPQPAPYVAVTAEVRGAHGRAEIELASGDVRLTGWYDAPSGRVGLDVGVGPVTTTHRSRRWGRASEATALALTLTGTHLTVLTGGGVGGGGTARGRVDLAARVDTRDEAFCAGLRAVTHGVVSARVGGFGQLGLRDLRLVTEVGGDPVCDGDDWLLTATHAGPGFFDTAHTGVWTLSADGETLVHRSDLFFRRPDRPGVFGDHSTHLVRDGDRWLAATSTWGDFDLSTPAARRTAIVGVTLAETDADLLHGRHVLDTRALAMPTDGLVSVATWDPHLAHDGDRWLVGFVSARKFFRFHPALAAGPSLDSLTLLADARDRRATEGTTLVRVGDRWLVAASDGRDGRRGERRGYPLFDLGLQQIGALDATYATNLPWPSLARDGDDWLLVTFDGTPAGGALLGYGTHGDVVVQRSVSR
jgi:hypothetical protein